MWLKDLVPRSAIAHLNRAVELDPNNPQIRTIVYVMGQIHEAFVVVYISCFIEQPG